MPERQITDATGDRWDVKEEEGSAGRGFRLSFRHQSGRRLEIEDARQGVNALTDKELLDMLAKQTGDRNVTEGEERRTDADGYVTE